MTSKQLQTLKNYNDTLAKFIVRFSSAFDGYSPELDAELQILRGHLSGQPDFTLSTISINKLNGLLMSQATSLKQYKSATVAELEDTAKHLQRQAKDLPDQFQRSTEILISLSQPTRSMFTLVNQCLDVLGLYRKVEEFGSVQEAVSDVQDATTSRLKSEIVAELGQLIETYSLRTPNDEQLKQLKNKLNEGISDQELLQACIFLIRLIVRDTIGEVNVTGKVINGLHKAIGGVTETVSQTIESSKHTLQTKLDNNKVLREQIDDMGDMVNQSQSLDKLKQDAQSYLEKFASTLSQQEEAEREEQQALITLLDQMQKQLTQLQKQTHSYRRKLAEQRLSSHTDPLTKIPNRVAYNERVQKEWELSHDSGSPMSMALVDIDHFKNINDKYGHAAGDKTLQVIAKHLKRYMSPTDFLARWGGEEFVILFPGKDAITAQPLLEQIRETLEDLPFKFRQEKVTITASIGATSYTQGEGIEKMFDRADKNLYEAKNSGRNKVVAK